MDYKFRSGEAGFLLPLTLRGAERDIACWALDDILLLQESPYKEWISRGSEQCHWPLQIILDGHHGQRDGEIWSMRRLCGIEIDLAKGLRKFVSSL